MKHKLDITLLILFFFVLSQILGIITLEHTTQINKIQIQNKTEYKIVEKKPIGTERITQNDKETQKNVLITIILGLLTGFLLMKLLIKTKSKNLWIIIYYYITYVLTYITLTAFLSKKVSIILAITIIILKNIKITPQLIKNFLEILIYPAFALMFSPIITPLGGIIMLILLSLYDAYAVWKSKSMIELANFQLNTKFTGLLFEYEEEKENKKQKKETQTTTKLQKVQNTEEKIETKKVKTQKAKKQIKKIERKNYRKALLGGGDLAFTTIFTGTIYLYLGLYVAILTIIFSTIGLAYLFYNSEKGKMYPAMPFITFFAIMPTIAYYIVYFLNVI